MASILAVFLPTCLIPNAKSIFSNEFDFELCLEAGKSFIAPAIICGYTSRGFERMSHNLHKFANDNILRSGLRPVLYNSWEATEFKVTCNEQIKLAKKAK